MSEFRNWGEIMRKNLWNKNCHRFDNEELTDDMIEHAEIKLGAKLPAEYIGLMKEKNGGSLNYSYFSVSGENTNKLGKYILVDHIMGIGKNDEGILQTSFFAKEFGIKPQLIPFYGDGDFWICFDYTKKGPFREPAISYVYSHSGEAVEISPDFRSFLQELKQGKNIR